MKPKSENIELKLNKIYINKYKQKLFFFILTKKISHKKKILNSIIAYKKNHLLFNR